MLDPEIEGYQQCQSDGEEYHCACAGPAVDSLVERDYNCGYNTRGNRAMEKVMVNDRTGHFLHNNRYSDLRDGKDRKYDSQG